MQSEPRPFLHDACDGVVRTWKRPLPTRQTRLGGTLTSYTGLRRHADVDAALLERLGSEHDSCTKVSSVEGPLE